MRRASLLLAAAGLMIWAGTAVAQPARPEAGTPASESRQPPPDPPVLIACSQTQVNSAVQAELAARPASTSRSVGGAVAGTAGSIAGGAVAGPVGAVVGGAVAGTVGRVVTSAVTGESRQAERDEERARDTLRWCTADGRMLSLDPVAPAPADTGRSPSS